MFKYNTLIRKNTPEIIKSLTDFGFKKSGRSENGQYIITHGQFNLYMEFDSDELITEFLKHSNDPIYDCKEDIQLFNKTFNLLKQPSEYHKNLIVDDLGGRILYGVKGFIGNENSTTIDYIDFNHYKQFANSNDIIIYPILYQYHGEFTHDKEEEIDSTYHEYENCRGDIEFEPTYETLDFYNKNHIDYRDITNHILCNADEFNIY